jgi:uncharacterized protein DUF2752
MTVTSPLPAALPAAVPAAPDEPAQPVALPPHYYYGYQPPPKGRFARFIDRLPAWSGPAGVAGIIGGGIAYTLLMRPTAADATSTPTCIVKLLTGFDCPGCGGTRAAWYLLHGDVPAAARHHAIFTFAVPFLLYMYVAWAGKRLFNWKLPQLTIGPRTMIAFVAVWGVWSVLRNLPWAPFTAFYV